MGSRKRCFGLEGEQPIKEGSVALERLAKILGGNVVALAPLIFQRGSLGGKLLGDALDDVGDQTVGLFDRVPGLIDERRLDFLPASAEVVQLVVGEQRAGIVGGGRTSRLAFRGRSGQLRRGVRRRVAPRRGRTRGRSAA